MFSILLLFCFVNNCGTSPVPVTGKKGGNVTLPCESEARQISDVVLSRVSKKILVCGSKGCESKNSRVFKEGACDIFIKDLRLSDAGIYILNVYRNNDQTELERKIKYQLHIRDKSSVKIGDQLKLDVLLASANKVETNSSGKWTEVWSRDHGVCNDRLNDSDGKLTIKEFTASDVGSYRVLDFEGEILITVTVTESGSAEGNTPSPHSAQEHWSWVEKFLFGYVTSIFFGYIVIMVIQVVLRVVGMLRCLHDRCYL